MKLLQFLAALPNIKPRAAKEALKSWHNDLFNKMMANMEGDHTRMKVTAGAGIKLGFRDMNEIFAPDDLAPVQITPYGAGIVLKLYQNGLLPMAKKALPVEVPEAILKYAESSEKVNEVRKRLRNEWAAEEIAYRQILSSPTDIKYSDFTYKLLNDIFIYHNGLGGNAITMEIGGNKVTKTLHAFSSNSGKSQNWEVTFSWIDKDGIPRVLVKPSMYAGNRRNDADRNWGLPE